MHFDLKPSVFNVFRHEGDVEYVSNTLTRCLLEIDSEHAAALRGDVSLDGLPATDLQLLRDQGIVVPAELDEHALLRYWQRRGTFSKELAEIAIAPTMACNFACPYCFEDRRSGSMSAEVQEALIGHVSNLMKEGIRALHISWYGGEPLLCLGIVEHLSTKIRQLGDSQGVPIYFSMTTNGYLLDDATVDVLASCGVNEVQVTLDGGRETHDSRRHLSNGGPTFDRIMENIAGLASRGIRATVRVNVDMANPGGYSEVRDYVYDHGISVSSVYPAIVEMTSNQSKEQRQLCYSHRDYSDALNGDILDYFLEDGYDSMRLVACNCGAEHAYSCVVDDQGYLYKCWNDVGRAELAYANLLDGDIGSPAFLVRYLGRDTASEPECSDCPYLPICLGGCLWEYMDKGTHACCTEKQLYWDIVLDNEGGEMNEGDSQGQAQR